MAVLADIIARVRSEIGDLGRNFAASSQGDGQTTRFDLPEQMIDPVSVVVTRLDPDGSTTILTNGVDYTLDDADGVLTIGHAPDVGSTVVVQGRAHSFFTDAEMTTFVNDAVLQHCHGRQVSTRTLGTDGFIHYTHVDMDLSTLPPVEDYLISLLATIEALWTLTTDAASDVDISTAEGTHVPRTQRFSQLRAQIDALTERYHYLCQQLNVGLGRIEMSNLRRVSRTTNRLVPLFVEREYDETTLPIRILPEIDHEDDDPNGPPSPAWGIY